MTEYSYKYFGSLRDAVKFNDGLTGRGVKGYLRRIRADLYEVSFLRVTKP